MAHSTLSPDRPRDRRRPRGFTIMELMVGSSIMLLVVIGALALYTHSNKVSVDQQALAQIQQDVRSGMFFVQRDCRMTGAGLTPDIAGYFLEGVDGLGPNPETADSLRLFGNFDEPLGLRIQQYQGGTGGGAATAFLYQWELENLPYPCPEWYEERTFLIISTRCPGCMAFRYIADNSLHGCGSGTAHFNMQPGQSEINPPGGLISETGCDQTCWDDAIITLGEIRLYWLDTTGNPGDYPSLNLVVGQKGYLGIPNTLYRTGSNEAGIANHIPLAQNIENLQFEYNGDLDDDGNLDGFRPWQNADWTMLATDDQATRDAKMQLIQRIRQIRIMILGRTPNPFVSVSGTPPTNVHIFRRPVMSNSPAATADDLRKRFLVESVATIRNMNLGLYNEGVR